ncbi:MAG: ThiF family adenylyltransferase [Kiritimatiellae bacterium]|nr:ThiF family adenylyltransferase [Kiritimatiellia bacterium]
MDPEACDRTRRLLGDEGVGKLRRARVLVCGLGGVGSWCVEALTRSGVGSLGLLDCDSFAASNLNRQLGALRSTLGRRKTDVERERVLDVNPGASVEVFDFRYGPDTAALLDLSRWDVVVDAVDQVSSKVLLAVRAREAGVRLVSAMGGGNKFEPSRFRAADLRDTDRCPLAKAMRKKLRRLGVSRLPVVFSDEEPRRPFGHDPSRRVQIAGTLPTVTGVEGLLLAHEVVRMIVGAPAAPLACSEPSGAPVPAAAQEEDPAR